ATWEAEWQRKVAKQQVAEAKEQVKMQLYLSKYEAEQSAEERTRELQAEWHALENLLKTAIQHEYVRNWDSLKRTDGFPKPRPKKPDSTTTAVPAKPEPPI